jgi:hypothetical protein
LLRVLPLVTSRWHDQAMADAPSELEHALALELDRRIRELATSDTVAVENIGAWDAIVVVVLFILVPLALIWWAA